MMKQTSIIALLLFSISCASTKKAKTYSTELNGNWIPIQQEMAGKELPKAVFQTHKNLQLLTHYILLKPKVLTKELFCTIKVK